MGKFRTRRNVSKIPNDVLGFTALGCFFWRRETDRKWCCISAKCGLQYLVEDPENDYYFLKWWSAREEVFRKGDALVFELS